MLQAAPAPVPTAQKAVTGDAQTIKVDIKATHDNAASPVELLVAPAEDGAPKAHEEPATSPSVEPPSAVPQTEMQAPTPQPKVEAHTPQPKVEAPAPQPELKAPAPQPELKAPAPQPEEATPPVQKEVRPSPKHPFAVSVSRRCRLETAASPAVQAATVLYWLVHTPKFLSQTISF